MKEPIIKELTIKDFYLAFENKALFINGRMYEQGQGI